MSVTHRVTNDVLRPAVSLSLHWRLQRAHGASSTLAAGIDFRGLAPNVGFARFSNDSDFGSFASKPTRAWISRLLGFLSCALSSSRWVKRLIRSALPAIAPMYPFKARDAR